MSVIDNYGQQLNDYSKKLFDLIEAERVLRSASAIVDSDKQAINILYDTLFLLGLMVLKSTTDDVGKMRQVSAAGAAKWFSIFGTKADLVMRNLLDIKDAVNTLPEDDQKDILELVSIFLKETNAEELVAADRAISEILNPTEGGIRTL